QIIAEDMLSEHDGMRILVGQDGVQVRTRFQVRVEIHHVAAIAEGGGQVKQEIAAADDAADRNFAIAEPVQPGRQEDGEAAVAIDVDREAKPLAGMRIDFAVKSANDIVHRGLYRGGIALAPIKIHLAVPPDGTQVRRDGNVAGGVFEAVLADEKIK